MGRKILLVIGIILILDGIISIAIQPTQPIEYQLIRVARMMIGAYLIYYSRMRYWYGEKENKTSKFN